ncbi:hypothetical protein AB0K21_44360 [Streptosporangium sp. NPDC049248]|uniref:hypothetical protein n=1 Tax=Streptosporangium sp. NPDC049248 TaxID=3155651 RepID=UPI00343A94A7
MADWHARKEVGDQHEHRVARELEDRGWTVHFCGQGTYPPAIQQALSRTDSQLRQFPDLIAARGADVITIDAKTRMSSLHTSRYAISRKCLIAGLHFLGTHAPIPLYYVFGQMGVLTPAEVMHYGSIGFRSPDGSYYLVNSHLAHRFDDVFGAPVSLVTA